MQYYSEEKMKDIREALEKEVLDWKGIGTRKMFGCPCYQKDKKLFVFLITDGIVITRLDDEGKDDLSKVSRVEPFNAGSKKIPKWAQVKIKNKKDLKKILPFVKRSYDSE